MSESSVIAKLQAADAILPTWLPADVVLSGQPVHADRNALLSRQGQAGTHVAVLEKGFAVASKRTPGGLQQNVALYVPGDFLDLESFTLGVPRVDITSLTPVSYFRLRHDSLRDFLDGDAEFARTFWRYVSFQTVLAHEWLVSLGRRTAYARTAHLMCEIVHRLHTAGHLDETRTALPLTQTELADTLGLSVVHINRTLQRLRSDGLVTFRRGELRILDWPRLQDVAGFDPFYLQFTP